MPNRLVEIIGWYGAVAILGGYALISAGTIPARGYLYQLLVLSGALSLSYVSLRKKANQPALVNIISAIVAVITIFSLLRS
ncbi:MAG: hypothetical protein HYY50_04610 [Candidatus Kerfeldbacteria bacterium]|nr:hypothetical protein [Candidatus Kerfeldbacteria bacterium]